MRLSSNRPGCAPCALLRGTNEPVFSVGTYSAENGLFRYPEDGLSIFRGGPFRVLSQVLRGLNVPVVRKSSEEGADHFGWIARFFGIEGPASSALTQERLGWRPVQPGLIADLNAAHYFEHAADAVVSHG